MGVLYLRGVERWAGERLLACDTLLYALLDIRPGYELKYCLHLKRVGLLPIIVLVVILDGQEGVREDVNEGHSYRRAQPAVTEMLHRVFQLYPSQSFKKREGSQTSEFKKKNIQSMLLDTCNTSLNVIPLIVNFRICLDD